MLTNGSTAIEAYQAEGKPSFFGGNFYLGAGGGAVLVTFSGNGALPFLRCWLD